MLESRGDLQTMALGDDEEDAKLELEAARVVGFSLRIRAQSLAVLGWFGFVSHAGVSL